MSNTAPITAPREYTATDNIDLILEQRGDNYGEFCDHAFVTQHIKNEMKMGDAWDKMTNSQRESLEMIAHKIGRICNGNPNYKDSWVDIAGYATLVAKQLS